MRELFVSVRVTLAFVMLGGVAYPVLLYALVHAAFPWQAETSLIRNRCGVIIGSAHVGQSFDGAAWFKGRPSAVGYNAASSGGSNFGPAHPALAESLLVRAARFREENGLSTRVTVPVDAVTASGSGLDPDVSVETAELQVSRIAAMRAISASKLHGVVQAHAQDGWMGTEARVNVLSLNLALDSIADRAPSCQSGG